MWRGGRNSRRGCSSNNADLKTSDGWGECVCLCASAEPIQTSFKQQKYTCQCWNEVSTLMDQKKDKMFGVGVLKELLLWTSYVNGKCVIWVLQQPFNIVYYASFFISELIILIRYLGENNPTFSFINKIFGPTLFVNWQYCGRITSLIKFF